MDSAERAQEKEAAATYSAGSGLREALFGNANEARRRSALAIRVRQAATCSMALRSLWRMPETERAQALTDDLGKRFPEDTIVRFNYLPTLHAKLAVTRETSEAIESLRAAAPYELGESTSSVYGWTALYPAFVRGEAYLADTSGRRSRRRVPENPRPSRDHCQRTHRCTGASRARPRHVMRATRPKLKAAYKDFLTLWKDADPDIPILKEAKAEYAKLQ